MRLVSFYSGNNQQNFNIRILPSVRRPIRYILSNKSPRLRLVLLFANNNWSSDLIYGCFRSLAKKFPIKNFALGI
jgi:hypothetical protein